MSVDELIDVKGVFNSTESVGYSDVEQLKRIVCSDQVSELNSEVQSLVKRIADGESSSALCARVGIALHLLGKHRQAVIELEKVTDNATAAFFHAVSLIALKRYDDADQQLEAA
ncbi:MAG: hypothetical protein ACF8CY_05545, partial [Gimesia chilikensis]